MKRWSAILLVAIFLLVPGFITTANNTEPSRFAAVDIYLQTGPAHLAAYQLDITLPEQARIVGVEGGEPAAFREAPYYDPAALMNHRIIVAAFSTADAGTLPTGNFRVARLHIMLGSGTIEDELPKITRQLTVAADAQGNTIAATLSLRAFEKQGDKP
jgi:hypothetical protein